MKAKDDCDKTAEQQRNEDDYFWDDEDDEPVLDGNCPNCGHEYDEIDYDYQICHICKYNNNKP